MGTAGSGSVILSLIVAVSAFAALFRAQDRIVVTRTREVVGLNREPVLDRSGRPLAFTTPEGSGHGTRRYSVPDSSTVIGYASPTGRWTGLERRYSSVLEPHPQGSFLGQFFMHLQGRSVEGLRVRTTIDAAVQKAADSALGGETGAVVAMDPRNGDVLGLVSKPNCSATQLRRAQGYRTCAIDAAAPLLNRATQRPMAPGSAFKLVTLTAALDSGLFHLDDVFSGPDAFGPSPYFDNNLYPSNITRGDLQAVTLEQALAFSDNFVFAHVGLTIGAPTFLSYARRFLFDGSIPFDLPTSRSTIAGGKGALSNSELAQASFGAPVDRATPLQMALVASTVANGGVMMAPRLVLDHETTSGVPVRKYSPRSAGKVMKRRTASQINGAMQFVVDNGSGHRAQISGIKVAGKTGTAESGSELPNAWFVAFAPAVHPVVAVAVLVEQSGEGADYAAPVARTVLLAALRTRGYHIQ